jgi:hypothetical protein
MDFIEHPYVLQSDVVVELSNEFRLSTKPSLFGYFAHHQLICQAYPSGGFNIAFINFFLISHWIRNDKLSRVLLYQLATAFRKTK